MTEENRRQGSGDEWISYPLPHPAPPEGEASEPLGSPASSTPPADWTTYGEGVYQCEVWVVREPSGEYSAFAAHLPGVVAQGADPDEAIAEMKSAAGATIRSYMDLGRSIPWTREPIELDQLVPLVKRWVLVRA